MNPADSPFPIAPRRRRRLWPLAAVAGMAVVGVLPIRDIAQASRKPPAPAASRSEARSLPPRPIDRPATITLGAMIEIQRRAREARRELATAERGPGNSRKQGAGNSAPGERWHAQLGAFSTAEAAERQQARLAGAGVAAVVRQEGGLHRLQSLPALRADTQGLCARAQAGGIDCFVRRAADAL